VLQRARIVKGGESKGTCGGVDYLIHGLKSHLSNLTLGLIAEQKKGIQENYMGVRH